MPKFVLLFFHDDPLTALRLLKSFAVDEFTTLCESNMGGNVEGVHPLADGLSGPTKSILYGFNISLIIKYTSAHFLSSFFEIQKVKKPSYL